LFTKAEGVDERRLFLHGGEFELRPGEVAGIDRYWCCKLGAAMLKSKRKKEEDN
jgi:hypothetical protein